MLMAISGDCGALHLLQIMLSRRKVNYAEQVDREQGAHVLVQCTKSHS